MPIKKELNDREKALFRLLREIDMKVTTLNDKKREEFIANELLKHFGDFNELLFFLQRKYGEFPADFTRKYIIKFYNDNIERVKGVDENELRDETSGKIPWYAWIICIGFPIFVFTYSSQNVIDDVYYLYLIPIPIGGVVALIYIFFNLRYKKLGTRKLLTFFGLVFGVSLLVCANYYFFSDIQESVLRFGVVQHKITFIVRTKHFIESKPPTEEIVTEMRERLGLNQDEIISFTTNKHGKFGLIIVVYDHENFEEIYETYLEITREKLGIPEEKLLKNTIWRFWIGGKVEKH